MKMFTIRLILRCEHFNCLYNSNIYLVEHIQIFNTLENFLQAHFFISSHKFNTGSAHPCAIFFNQS